MKLKEFDDNDWYGFAGAEVSEHDDPPRITYSATVDDRAYVVVVERTSIQFMPNGDDSLPTYMKSMPFKQGIILINALIEDVSSELLVDILGFIKLGDL